MPERLYPSYRDFIFNCTVLVTKQSLVTRDNADWASKNGSAAGYPNFHQLNRGKGLFYGAILFQSEAVDRQDIPAQELGFPARSEERFRAINNWATRRGYVGGFPNFNQADYGQGVVFGAVLIKKGYGQGISIPLSELK